MDDWFFDVFFKIFFVVVFVLAVVSIIAELVLKFQIINGNIQNIPSWAMWLYLLKD